jgi:uncharacterized protein YfkK (UPF0435 family)
MEDDTMITKEQVFDQFVRKMNVVFNSVLEKSESSFIEFVAACTDDYDYQLAGHLWDYYSGYIAGRFDTEEYAKYEFEDWNDIYHQVNNWLEKNGGHPVG